MAARAIPLDFQAKPASRWRVVGLALFAAAMALAGWAASQQAADDDLLETLQARQTLLRQRLRGELPMRAGAPPDAQAVHRIQRANEAIDQLALPWDELFAAVEAADARGLGLLALTPDAKLRTLRLAGEARTMPELLAYVERLAAQPALRQVHLLGYETVQRDGAEVVAFTLQARWTAP